MPLHWISPLGSMAWQVQSNYGQRERVPLPLGRQPHTRAHSSPWGPQLTEEYQVLATQERTVLGVPWKGTLLALAGNGAYIWKWQQCGVGAPPFPSPGSHQAEEDLSGPRLCLTLRISFPSEGAWWGEVVNRKQDPQR